MTERNPISGSSRDYGAMDAPNVGFSDSISDDLSGLFENIQLINMTYKTLDKIMKKIGGPNDNLQLRDKIHDMQQKANNAVSVTAREIKRLDVLSRKSSKAEKLQVERFMRTFSEALAKYSSLQKDLSEKMSMNMPSQPRPRLSAEEQAIADDDEANLIANQQLQVRQVQFDTNLLLDKEAYINKIEADVLDVNQIMQDLSELVREQAQTVDSVESHIEAGLAHVESGVDELAKAAEYQRRYRRKMFIIILIAIVFAIIFIVWVVKAFR